MSVAVSVAATGTVERVVVVVLNWNREADTRECLASLEAHDRAGRVGRRGCNQPRYRRIPTFLDHGSREIEFTRLIDRQQARVVAFQPGQLDVQHQQGVALQAGLRVGELAFVDD